MRDNCNINNLAKNQVPAALNLCTICRNVSPTFTKLCIETSCLCPSEGHKHGSRNITKTYVVRFCYWKTMFYSTALTHWNKCVFKCKHRLVTTTFKPPWTANFFLRCSTLETFKFVQTNCHIFQVNQFMFTAWACQVLKLRLDGSVGETQVFENIVLRLFVTYTYSAAPSNK